MHKIKAILFDLDGVLIDSYWAWFHQFNDTLRHFGYKPINETLFRRHWGRSTEDDVRIFMPTRTVNEVKAHFNEHYHEYTHYLNVEPHVHETLRELKEMGLRLGCVTNSHERIVKKILEGHKLTKLFDAVVTADDVCKAKPAPDMVLEVCRRLEVLPQESIFLGDTATDLKAGIAARCQVVGYKIKAQITVRNLNEFLLWVKHFITDA